MPAMSFGALLRKYRTAAGLTQEELAARAGLSARSISDLERGVRRTPYKSTIELLAEILQLAPPQRALFVAAGRRGPTVPPLVSALPSGASNSPWPFVGRTAELALVEHHFAGEGPPLLLLAGEPGIGKTRLLREAATLARETGWAVLEGGCSRRGGQEPYAPVLAALEGRLHAGPAAQVRAELEGCAWLVRLLPELAEMALLSVPEQDLSPEQERRLLFAAVARYLANSAGPAGTLLLLDDLQWAGADALDLLSSLIRSPVHTPLRVIGAYRDTEVWPQDPLMSTLADLARDELVRQQAIGPLASAEAAQLVGHLLEDAPDAANALAEALFERTGGVPFFLISCAQGLGSGALETTVAAKDTAIPWNVQQSIRQRAAALPQAAQDVLALAAVAGRQVSGGVLVAAAPWPERDVLDALDAACQARLLVEEGDTYQFAHDLIREVVEGDLRSARRQTLHRDVALAYERRPEECPPELLAYHYRQAGELNAALRALLHAAHRAQQAAAHREVVELLKDAIDLASRTGQQQLIPPLRAWRGTTCRTLARWPEADAELSAALEDLAAEQMEQRAEILTTLAEVRHWLLDGPSTRRFGARALALAEQSGRHDLAAAALNALALADSSDGHLAASLDHFQRAFTRAGPAHLASLVSGVELSGLIHYWMGQFEEATQRSQQALELAHQSYDTTSTARALANLGLALTGTGRYREALQTFTRARQFAQEHGTGQWLARAIAMCGGLHLDVFDFSGAEALAEEARQLGQALNWPFAVISGGIDLLVNFARRQEIGSIEPLVKELIAATATAQGAHGWLWRLRLAAAQGELALVRGDWEGALRAALDTMEQSHRLGRVKYQVLGLEIQAKALAGLGKQQEGITGLRQAVALARPTGDPAMLLRPALALLALEGDGALLKEARACASTMRAELSQSHAELTQRFLAAEPLRVLGKING